MAGGELSLELYAVGFLAATVKLPEAAPTRFGGVHLSVRRVHDSRDLAKQLRRIR
jgi:hypothetical protein